MKWCLLVYAARPDDFANEPPTFRNRFLERFDASTRYMGEPKPMQLVQVAWKSAYPPFVRFDRQTLTELGEVKIDLLGDIITIRIALARIA